MYKSSDILAQAHLAPIDWCWEMIKKVTDREKKAE